MATFTRIPSLFPAIQWHGLAIQKTMCKVVHILLLDAQGSHSQPFKIFGQIKGKGDRRNDKSV